MQIVIEIPDGIYDTIQADEMISREQLAVLQMKILNGTPLPKGHGRLIDSDDMIEDLHRQCKEVFKLDAVKPEDYYIAKDAKFMQATWKEWCDSFCVWANNRKTIIDADGGDAE